MPISFTSTCGGLPDVVGRSRVLPVICHSVALPVRRDAADIQIELLLGVGGVDHGKRKEFVILAERSHHI